LAAYHNIRACNISRYSCLSHNRLLEEKMITKSDKFFNDTYALGKLEEFAHEIFVGLVPARQKLSENLHYIAIINPTDFRKLEHQTLWEELQKRLIGKTKNIWLERNPIDRLTVRNNTLSFALEAIWKIHEECKG